MIFRKRYKNKFARADLAQISLENRVRISYERLQGTKFGATLIMKVKKLQNDKKNTNHNTLRQKSLKHADSHAETSNLFDPLMSLKQNDICIAYCSYSGKGPTLKVKLFTICITRSAHGE